MKPLPRNSIPLWLAPLLLAACTTAPGAPIPDPLPEALEWVRAEREADGAFLGLHTRENDSGSLDDLFFLPGARVVRVIENSPAAEAGLRPGDVVLTFEGHEVADPRTLETLERSAQAGSEIELEVQRGDTVFAVPVRLGGASGEPVADVRELYRLDPARSMAAWGSAGGGAVLVASAPGGPFEDLEPGSVVTAVDEHEVLGDSALLAILRRYEPGARVVLHYADPTGKQRVDSFKLRSQAIVVTDLTIPILAGYEADAEGTEEEFYLLDIWLIWLFRYERRGQEREWSFLRFFTFQTGVGELSE